MYFTSNVDVGYRKTLLKTLRKCYFLTRHCLTSDVLLFESNLTLKSAFCAYSMPVPSFGLVFSHKKLPSAYHDMIPEIMQYLCGHGGSTE